VSYSQPLPPLPPPPLAVLTTGRQAEFRIFLENVYFLINFLKNPRCRFL
jgi:hypothetical protein